MYNEYTGAQLSHWEIDQVPESELNLAIDYIMAKLEIGRDTVETGLKRKKRKVADKPPIREGEIEAEPEEP